MSSAKAYKIRITGPDGQRLEQLSKMDSVIGRSAQADIVVANPEVSRRHAILKLDGPKVTIVDLESKNGTFVDDHQIPSGGSVTLRPGQVLRFGLAPERLQIEIQDESSITLRVPNAAPHQSKTQTLAEPPPIKRGPVAVVPESTEPASSVDLASAHKIHDQSRELAEQRQLIEGEKRSWQMQLQNMHHEKTRLEGQISELAAELRLRLDERKESARLGADAKLKAQNLEQEVHRLEKAKEQLMPALNSELSSFDAKIAETRAQYEKESEALKTKLAKESKDALDAVKKQAELIINEAEIKARTLKEKTQTELADLRRSQELDLSEMKLKQVAEMKNQEDREEKKWNDVREKKTSAFLREVRQNLEETVYASQMEAATKLRILTSLEESLHRHFNFDSTTSNGHGILFEESKTKIQVAPEATVTPIRRPTVHDEVTAPKIVLAQIKEEVSQPRVTLHASMPPAPTTNSQPRIELNPTIQDRDADIPPPLWQRHRRTLINVSGFLSAVALILVGMKIQMGRENPVEKWLAQNKSPDSAVAPYVNVGRELSSEQSANPPPPEPQVAANAGTLAPSNPAISKTHASSVVGATTAPDRATNLNDSSWARIFSSPLWSDWQKQSRKFVLHMPKMDQRRYLRYQELETRFSAGLSMNRNRGVASDGERAALEKAFTRDALQVLGSANWQRLLNFRDQFLAQRR